MDWVKSKAKSRKHSKPRKPLETSSVATQWLDSLCLEQVNEIQKQIRPPKTSNKSKTRHRWSRLDALWWGLSALDVEDATDLQALASILRQCGSTAVEIDTPLTPSQIVGWLQKQLPVRSDEPCVALACCGWLYGIAKLGNQISPDQWLEVLQLILSQIELNWANRNNRPTLAALIWTIEIPLAVAALLLQAKKKDPVVKHLQFQLETVLAESAEDCKDWLCDGGKFMRSNIASVLRSRRTLDGLNVAKWKSETKSSLRQLSAYTICLTDRNGNALLTLQDHTDTDHTLWKVLAETCGNSEFLCLLQNHRRITKEKSFSAKTIQRVASTPSQFYDEDSELAVMRQSLLEPSPGVAVDFSTDPMWLNVLDGRGQKLISGSWRVDILKGGKTLEFDNAWSEVCWFSDSDVDYLEVETKVNNQTRLQRQIALFRDSGAVFLADALHSQSEGEWELHSTIEVAEGANCQVGEKTNEAFFSSATKRKSARRGIALPIGLPEWKRRCVTGHLSSQEQQLTLVQRTVGKRIYAPLLLVLNSKDQSRPFTWRHLTVAQNRELLSDQIARAFRVRFGKEHLFLYRSMDGCQPRSAMGVHVNTEFFAGAFSSEDGSVEQLLQVDP